MSAVDWRMFGADHEKDTLLLFLQKKEKVFTKKISSGYTHVLHNPSHKPKVNNQR